MADFRIDIYNTRADIVVKVTAECRCAFDITELIASLKAVRETLGPVSASAGERGKGGGIARAAALSPQRRSEIAREAANVRWKR